MLQPDFGLTARDYSTHRVGFPDSFFARLARRGIGLPGQSVVDLATGTGTVARGFAARGCRVIAVDRSPALIAAARDLDRRAGVAVEYVQAHAERTGLGASAPTSSAPARAGTGSIARRRRARWRASCDRRASW